MHAGMKARRHADTQARTYILTPWAPVGANKSDIKNTVIDRCRLLLLVQAVCLILSGLFCLTVFPRFFSRWQNKIFVAKWIHVKMFSILESKMMIKPGTIGYEAWKKPNIPTKIKWDSINKFLLQRGEYLFHRIYLFSVQNPKEVENNGKPLLEEVGPFTYTEETERINEVFSEVS